MTSVLSVVSLILLFWTSGHVCPSSQSQGESFTYMFPCLCAMDSSESPVIQTNVIQTLWYLVSLRMLQFSKLGRTVMSLHPADVSSD